MTFSEIIKNDADQKHLQLLSGKTECNITRERISSCKEFVEKNKIYHQRLVSEAEELKNALGTIKTNKEEADKAKKNAELAAKRAEKERLRIEKERAESAKARRKKIRIICIVLLAVVGIACIAMIPKWKQAAKEAATDVSKIDIQVVNKKSYHKENDGNYAFGRYYVDLTFKMTNNTKVDWGYLKITTYVYDKNGKSLGTITSEFGSSYGTSDLDLKVGKAITKDTSIAEHVYEPSDFSDFFAALYNSNLSDLKFESKVTYGSYYE